MKGVKTSIKYTFRAQYFLSTATHSFRQYIVQLSEIHSLFSDAFKPVSKASNEMTNLNKETAYVPSESIIGYF